MNQAPAEDGKWSINVTAGQQKVHVGRVSEDDDRLALGSLAAEPGVGFPELGEGEDLCRSQVGMGPSDLVEEGLEACRGNADRVCGAADQDMVRVFHLQVLDRSIGGISGLGDGGKLFSEKIGCNRIDLLIRNECILCIAAIEGTSHLAHEGDDLLAVRQTFRIGRLGNLARALCAQDLREGGRRGEVLPREDLRMVEAEGADADERPPGRT